MLLLLHLINEPRQVAHHPYLMQHPDHAMAWGVLPNFIIIALQEIIIGLGLIICHHKPLRVLDVWRFFFHRVS
jgi:hypothetical protein